MSNPPRGQRYDDADKPREALMTAKHPAFHEIRRMDRERDWTYTGPVTHHLEFATEADDMSLLSFDAEGPIHLPSEGERIKIYGVPVRVTDVETVYETTSEGAPSVYTTVSVTPVDDE